jgi:beta-glucosidase
MKKDTVSIHDKIEISIHVKNTGNYSGAEVVQVYFSDLVATVTRPEKLLVRFKKIFLNPGEEQPVVFKLYPEQDLSFTGIDYEKVVEPGEFEILIGNSSDNILLARRFTLE